MKSAEVGTLSSYAVLRERVPRLDQQARIGLHSAELMLSKGFRNLLDVIIGRGQPENENRMAFAHRRAGERAAAFEHDVEGYIIERGFGTEAAREIIAQRQARPVQLDAEAHQWVP